MRLTHRRRGAAILEVMVGMAALTISIGGLGMSVLTTQRASADLARRDLVRAQGTKLMERLLALPFGGAGDAAADPASPAVPQLFDDDTSVVNAGSMTVMALRTPVGSAGWRFHVGGFEPGGVWEVEINNDLDGNGVLTGVRGCETPTVGDASPGGDGRSIVTLTSEGRTDLYRLEVFHDGRSVAKTFRSSDE